MRKMEKYVRSKMLYKTRIRKMGRNLDHHLNMIQVKQARKKKVEALESIKNGQEM